METQFNDFCEPNCDIDYYYLASKPPARKWSRLMKLTMMIQKEPNAFNVIKNIIKKNPKEISMINSHGLTALAIACINCNTFSSIECVKLLIDYGADVNCGDYDAKTPLMYASQHANSSSSIECVKLLIDSGANVNEYDVYENTSLTYAYMGVNTSSSMECIKLLIDSSPKINDKPIYLTILEIVRRNPSIPDYLFGPIKILIELGADVNEKNFHGKTALMYACYNMYARSELYYSELVIINQFRLIKLLIESGANPNEKDEEGNTCLHELFKKKFIYKHIESIDIDTLMLLIYKSRATICDENKYGITAFEFYKRGNNDFLSEEQLEYLKGTRCLSFTKPAIR